MEIDEDMGAIPAAVLAMPGRIRGDHPLCSFTAAGPLADELVSGQKPLDVFAPLSALAEADGSVILMGVGLGSMTLIHLAERMAGRNLFRRWANGSDGQPMMVEVGGCGGFDNFKPIFSRLMKETKVGQSTWLVFPAKGALEAATRAIQEDPRVTHCDNPRCGRCNDAVMGGPILTTITGA
jgi:aminoglycoside 3-N-acetyltransferase